MITESKVESITTEPTRHISAGYLATVFEQSYRPYNKAKATLLD